MRPVFQFGAFAGTVGEYDHRAWAMLVAMGGFPRVWFLNTARPGRARARPGTSRIVAIHRPDDEEAHKADLHGYISEVNAYGTRPRGAVLGRRSTTVSGRFGSGGAPEISRWSSRFAAAATGKRATKEYTPWQGAGTVASAQERLVGQLAVGSWQLAVGSQESIPSSSLKPSRPLLPDS